MPGIIKELANPAEMPRLNSPVGSEVVPGMTALGGAVAIPVSNFLKDAEFSLIDSRLDALEAESSSGIVFAEDWLQLQTVVGSEDGVGAEVLNSDTGSHSQATATGYDGASVLNAGRYRYSSAWGRWVRIGDTFYSSATDDIQTLRLQNQANQDNLLRTTMTIPIFFDTGQPQPVISSVTNPSSRYSFSYLNSSEGRLELNLGAVLYTGFRMDSVPYFPGFSYSAIFEFPGAPNALVTSNFGVSMGFDDSVFTGPETLIGGNARGWVWRANGVLLSTDYNGGGGAGSTDPTYDPVVTSGAVPAFTDGDQVGMTLHLSTSGSVEIVGHLNGTEEFRAVCPAVAVGNLLVSSRTIGAPEPNTSLTKIKNLQAGTVQDGILSEVNTFEVPSKKPENISVQDYNGLRIRTSPGDFANLIPVKVEKVSFGKVQTDTTLFDAWKSKYPNVASGANAFVSPSGSDASGVVGDPESPFASINSALQSEATVIVLEDGEYEPIDYRTSQSAGGVMKLVIARNAKKAKIKNPHLDYNDSTFQLFETDVYRVRDGVAVGQSDLYRKVHRVVRTDILDGRGQYTRMPRIASSVADTSERDANVIALNSQDSGWFFDQRSSEKWLYVKLGAGVNVDDMKAHVIPYRFGAAGTSRNFFMGSKIAIHGVVMEGVLNWAFPNVAASEDAEIWMFGCDSLFSPGYGVQVDGGGKFYTEESLIFASELDGINPDPVRSSTGSMPVAFMLNCEISDSGDKISFGKNLATNRQAISSHGGFFAAFGCHLQYNWGQEVADTSSGATNQSWYVGCVAYNGDPDLPSNLGFGFYGATREAWLDTCAVAGEPPTSLYVEGGATAKTFNCSFENTPTFSSPSVAPAGYTPETP